jgi:hypothetical protein
MVGQSICLRYKVCGLLCPVGSRGLHWTNSKMEGAFGWYIGSYDETFLPFEAIEFESTEKGRGCFWARNHHMHFFPSTPSTRGLKSKMVIGQTPKSAQLRLV